MANDIIKKLCLIIVINIFLKGHCENINFIICNKLNNNIYIVMWI